MKKILRYLRSSLGYLYVCFKWVILAALVGCVVGPFGAMFGLALNKATVLRTADPRLIYLLPLGGLVIVFLYQHFDPDGGGSTNQIFVAVREYKPLSLRTAPLIFVTTVITHLFGGSSGREGAALLLGGSLSGQIGRRLQLEARDCRLMTTCGMAGAFSAVFGTPLAATVFTLEVVDVGSMQYAALLPCLISALIGVFRNRPAGFCHCVALRGAKPEADAIFDRLCREYAAHLPGARQMAEALLGEMLVLCYRACPGNFAASRSPSAARVDQVQQYIEEHFTQELAVTGLAERFFISPCHLTHSFKEQVGYSPKQ